MDAVIGAENDCPCCLAVIAVMAEHCLNYTKGIKYTHINKHIIVTSKCCDVDRGEVKSAQSI